MLTNRKTITLQDAVQLCHRYEIFITNKICGICSAPPQQSTYTTCAGVSLPPAITRWMSCYLKRRQAATSFRGIKLSMRIVRTGFTQGSKLSSSLFNYYIANMSRPTPPVKRVCYADDITASEPRIPKLESIINS